MMTPKVKNTTKMKTVVSYLKEFSPVNLNGIKLDFAENADHVGIVCSTSGNLPNILQRISSFRNKQIHDVKVLYTQVTVINTPIDNK